MSKKVEAVAPEVTTKGGPDNLYMTINTINEAGKSVGFRIVDLKHYGTRNWLANHTWWAMHQGHLLEIQTATQVEVDEYLAQKAKELQDKFADEPTAVAA